MSWNLWENGVSPSLLYKFLTCKEQFRLHYIENLRRNKVRFSQDFGTLFHHVLQNWYNTKFNSKKALLSISEWLDNREFARHPTILTVDQLQKMEALARSLFVNYSAYYSVIDKKRKWIATEKYFRKTYTYPDGKTTHLNGKIDAIYIDRKTPNLLDTKVLSRIDPKKFLNGLSLDLQPMFYLYATGYKRMTYNIVRRPPDNIIKADEGSLASFTKRKTLEVKNRPKHYFMRFNLKVTSQDIKNWKEQQLDPIMQDLRLWYEGKTPHYLNPTSLETIYGECDLYDYIVLGDQRGVYEHIFAKKPNKEKENNRSRPNGKNRKNTK